MLAVPTTRSSCASCARLTSKRPKREPKERAKGRKRLRKGLKANSMASPDLPTMLLPYLMKISPRHVLLMSMTNKMWRDQVNNSHETWRYLYRVFEMVRLYPEMAKSLGG